MRKKAIKEDLKTEDWAKDLPEFTLPPEALNWEALPESTLPPEAFSWIAGDEGYRVEADRLETEKNNF